MHYYTQKGRLPFEIYNAPEGEKLFLFASMLVELENKAKQGGICPFMAK